jgi:(p)ppGpp synthase/HD superfamily hydrolase
MEKKLEAVRAFAASAHEMQRRRYTPDPYMIHPERVMEICALHTTEPCILYAALLHDVLEDTAVTREKMQSFLQSILEQPVAEQTLGIVVELTDVYTKSGFPQWNRQKRKQKEARRLGLASAAAQTIKYADIIDNCKGLATDDPDFAPRYLRECDLLLDHMKAGLPALYHNARAVVRQERETIKAST